jgi:uncharacterized surface protein with fasciclin (FAS1) repeats
MGEPGRTKEQPHVTSNPRRGVCTIAVAALALALTACTSDKPSAGSPASSGGSSSAPTTSVAPAANVPFGPGCSAVPAQGPGSFAGLARDPAVTAANHLPALSGLVSTVTRASLADSLNTQPNITVLAPVNAAFQALPADQVKALQGDNAKLTAVLTHHVIQGRLTPQQLAGTHTTLNNDVVTIAGSGESYTVAGAGTLSTKNAAVICGNVQTANATIYLIDQVLAPTAQ